MVTHTNNSPVLLLYSRKAIELLADKRTTLESRHHKIFGFRTFCTLTRTVWGKAYDDDPYAELILIEIERRINKTCEALAQCDHDLDALLHKHTGNRLLQSVALAYSLSSQLNSGEVSKEPTLVYPNPNLPHANMCSALLVLYDLLIRKMLVFRHFGIITGITFHKYIKDGRASLRGIFATPCQYKDLRITRDDIVNQTVEGIVAVEVNGPVPEAILSRSLLSKFRSGSYSSAHHSCF